MGAALRGAARRGSVADLARACPALLGPDVGGARSLGRLLFVEADALTFVQAVEATLNRASVKEVLLPAVIPNESEPLVPRNSFDRAARHPSLLVVARRPATPATDSETIIVAVPPRKKAVRRKKASPGSVGLTAGETREASGA